MRLAALDFQFVRFAVVAIAVAAAILLLVIPAVNA